MGMILWKVIGRLRTAPRRLAKNRYVGILKNVLSMYKHPYGNMEEMWNLLIKLSRGAADKISREVFVCLKD